MLYNTPLIWYSTANLDDGANRLLRLGGGETAVAPVTVGDVTFTPRLRFSIFADRILTIDLEESMDAAFTAGLAETSQSLITTANTYMTVFSLPAPQNGTGFYVLTRPYLRIRLTNASGVNTATLVCWVSAEK